MFQAILLVCLAGQCTMLHDTQGPYLTRDKCMARTESMYETLRQYMPPVPIVRVRNVECRRGEEVPT